MIFSNFRQECLNHFKVFNTASYLLLFFIFVSICLAFIIPQNLLSIQGPALLIIIIAIAQNSIASNIFEKDHKDGTLEFKMSIMSVDNIIFTKYMALTSVSLVILFILVALISVLYSIDFINTIKLGIIYSLMVIYVNAFTTLINAIQVYFGSVCNFLTTLIFPLIIPGIICSVLGIFHLSDYHIYLSLLLGLNFILLPIIFYMTVYLIRNIYNI
jgi:ABC-type transport system involved in cytochrome c biogenesis permease component